MRRGRAATAFPWVARAGAGDSGLLRGDPVRSGRRSRRSSRHGGAAQHRTCRSTPPCPERNGRPRRLPAFHTVAVAATTRTGTGTEHGAPARTVPGPSAAPPTARFPPPSTRPGEAHSRAQCGRTAVVARGATGCGSAARRPAGAHRGRRTRGDAHPSTSNGGELRRPALREAGAASARSGARPRVGARGGLGTSACRRPAAQAGRRGLRAGRREWTADGLVPAQQRPVRTGGAVRVDGAPGPVSAGCPAG